MATKKKGLFSGIVKKVISGDTCVVLGPPDSSRNGLPKEKRITVYGCRAPHKLFEDEGGNGGEHPFKQASKENLRKLLAGQKIQFRSFKLDGKVYGHVLLEGQDIGFQLVSSGMVFLSNKVDKKHHPPGFDKYAPAAQDAQRRKIGVYAENFPAPNPEVEVYKNANLKKFFQDKKGVQLDGYIDEVGYNFELGVFIPELQVKATSTLAGIDIPIFSGKKATQLRTWFYKKWFQHDLQFKIVNIGIYRNKDGEKLDKVEIVEFGANTLTESLLTNGFARVDSSAKNVVGEERFEQLLSWQQAAKEKRKNIWGGNIAETKKGSDQLSTIVEVHSGDSLSVVLMKTGEIKRVFLSNLRAPKVGNFTENNPGESFGFEAKEYVRKKYVGKPVKVELEFIKKIKLQRRDDNGKEIERSMQCASIFCDDENISLDIVTKGYAKVYPPRDDEPNTVHIFELLDAYKKAQEAKLGIHSGREELPPRYWDLTKPSTKKKVKTEFKFNTGSYQGLVAYVYSPTRLKIRLDSRNVFIVVQLNGLKCIQKDHNVPSFDNFAEESINWTKKEVNQRTVRIEVENIDRYGNFHGAVFLGKVNIGELLVQKGLAYSETTGRDAARYENEYKEAEAKAKASKAGFWGRTKELGFSPDKQLNRRPLPTAFKASATEIMRIDEFFVQDAMNSKVQQIQDYIDEHYDSLIKPNKKLRAPVNRGTWCLAPFDDDESFYRAKVTARAGDDAVRLTFVDFGNRDVIEINKLYRMPQALTKFPEQAMRCALAYVETHHSSTAFGGDTFDEFYKLVWEKQIRVEPISRDNDGTLQVIVTKPNSSSSLDSVNIKLLKKGLARVNTNQEIPAGLKEAFQNAETDGIEANPGFYNAFNDEYED